MMPEEMTVQRLRRVLEAYGADPARWPPGERAQALELLETSPELEGHRRLASDLDAFLDGATMRQASGELLADILSTAGSPMWRGWLGSLWPFGPIWKPALGLTVAALMGAVLGFFSVTPAEIVEISNEIESFILG